MATDELTLRHINTSPEGPIISADLKAPRGRTWPLERRAAGTHKLGQYRYSPANSIRGLMWDSLRSSLGGCRFVLADPALFIRNRNLAACQDG